MFSFLYTIEIILGGMGVYISSPFLVNAFSKACEKFGINGLGTVSGTAAERVMVVILQQGDPGGHYRRALAHFPFQDVANRILDEYFDPTGNGKKTAPFYNINPSPKWIELAVAANFAFVWLAKEGHSRPVSINYLEKISLPFIYYLTGAMMAGVDVVSMGAGVVLKVPEVIDALLRSQTLRYPIPVIEADGSHGTIEASFNPWEFFGRNIPPLKRPAFLPIVSSNLLADIYAKKLSKGSIQGLIVERHPAGGHNAPPRGRLVLDPLGQPVYGPKDEIDFVKIAALDLPFWIGGGYASPKGLAEAEALGAQGIQVGTLFALCDQSGMNPLIREEVIRRWLRGELTVLKDHIVSPTGYPFNVACLPDTLGERSIRKGALRICDQGALRTCYRKLDGTIGYRCPSEPVDDYILKGGKLEDTEDRACLCSALIAATGLLESPNNIYSRSGQRPPIVTLGGNLDFLKYLKFPYSVDDALRYLFNIP